MGSIEYMVRWIDGVDDDGWIGWIDEVDWIDHGWIDLID